MSCKTLDACDDTCPVYDLCEVTVKGGECVPDGETRIICEGFKFSAKMDVEVKTNSACYEGYGYQVGNMQYDWEITNPCDRDWFDRRFVAQICDKYSMEITGYVQTDCGEWTAKETLTACIIEETGRDYGKGVTRSIKGKALHRILHDTKEDESGNISHASKSYADKIAQGIDSALTVVSPPYAIGKELAYGEEYEWLRKSFITGAKSGLGVGGLLIANTLY